MTCDDLPDYVPLFLEFLSQQTEAEAARLLALRSRQTPRIANRLLKRVRDVGQVDGEDAITQHTVEKALSFLGVEKYGIWLTIYTLVGWLTLFDLGLGNGLKLKLTEAFTKKKYHEAKKLISSAYVLIGSISLILMFLFWISNYFIHWEILLGLSNKQNTDISYSINLLALSFFIISKPATFNIFSNCS